MATIHMATHVMALLCFQVRKMTPTYFHPFPLLLHQQRGASEFATCKSMSFRELTKLQMWASHRSSLSRQETCVKVNSLMKTFKWYPLWWLLPLPHPFLIPVNSFLHTLLLLRMILFHQALQKNQILCPCYLHVWKDFHPMKSWKLIPCLNYRDLSINRNHH